MSGELSQLEKLEAFFRSEMAKRGGRVVYFLVQPSDREVTIMIDLDDDLFLDEEGKKTKDEFEEIERNFAVQQKDDKVVDAVKGLSNLEQRLSDPDGGIL